MSIVLRSVWIRWRKGVRVSIMVEMEVRWFGLFGLASFRLSLLLLFWDDSWIFRWL